jgi:hypothetical protein
LTSPPKRGIIGKQTTFGGNFEYISEPYNVKKEVEHIERLEHLKKMKDKPFS